jgi:hypothetical protein
MAATPELIEKATKFYKETKVTFRIGSYPYPGKTTESFFEATTEQAHQLGLLLDGRFAPADSFEFVGEGEFLGWTIGEIAETLAINEENKQHGNSTLF